MQGKTKFRVLQYVRSLSYIIPLVMNATGYRSGECIRLKNFVINSDINGNTIEDCGLYDYAFDGPNKNGEGVYIGTSTSQVRGGGRSALSYRSV